MLFLSFKKKISIIIPFYRGNDFLPRLFDSITKVARVCQNNETDIEVIVVNDSPDIDVILPQELEISVKVIVNTKNLGIQGARANGVSYANGDWILFLDQDDELLTDGFEKQLLLTKNSDVVVGNGIYQYGEEDRLIYPNEKVMKYIMREDIFIKIRNLIPSPGACLIKKDCIPDEWLTKHLKNNGSDDWFLWLLLFNQKRKFACNPKLVYKHNNANGENLSFDLDKMFRSSWEMQEYLGKQENYSKKKLNNLKKAIKFKYYQDTHQLNITKLFKYVYPIFNNCIYKLVWIIGGKL